MLTWPNVLNTEKHCLIKHLQKAEVEEEEESEGRVKVIVLGQAGLKMFFQLVVRFLHLGN